MTLAEIEALNSNDLVQPNVVPSKGSILDTLQRTVKERKELEEIEAELVVDARVSGAT